MMEVGKIRPGGQQRDFYFFIYFVYGWFFFSGNFLIALGCCLVPKAFLVSRWGGQGLGVLSLFLFFFLNWFIYLAMLSAVVAAGNPFTSCHHTTRYWLTNPCIMWWQHGWHRPPAASGTAPPSTAWREKKKEWNQGNEGFARVTLTLAHKAHSY